MRSGTHNGEMKVNRLLVERGGREKMSDGIGRGDMKFSKEHTANTVHSR